MPPRGRESNSRPRWNLIVASSVSVDLVPHQLGAAVLGLALLGPALLALCGEALLGAAVLGEAQRALCGAAVRRAPFSVGSGSGNGETWIAETDFYSHRVSFQFLRGTLYTVCDLRSQKKKGLPSFLFIFVIF